MVCNRLCAIVGVKVGWCAVQAGGSGSGKEQAVKTKTHHQGVVGKRLNTGDARITPHMGG